jgi:hypothetical protein
MTAANRFPMPFMISADAAARTIARVVAQGRRHAVLPWQMALVARILRVLPNALYDRLVATVPRKARQIEFD